MGAASYIGRIGGLAVALGVGTAIFTGHGVANATPTTGGQVSQTDGENGAGDDGNTTNVAPTTKDTDAGGPGEVGINLPRRSDVIGRHRDDDTTPRSVTATSIVKRLSDAAKRVTDAIESAADADNTVARTTSRTDGSSLTDRLAARTDRVGVETSTHESADGGAAQTNNVVANQFVNHAAAVKDWLASPSAVAGRSIDTSPDPAPPALWTPPDILAPLGTMKAAPGASTTTGRSSLLTTVLNAVNPFAGKTPGSPGVGSPLALVLAGAARREIGVESFAPQALLAPTTDSLTYDPDIYLDNGVITGENGSPTGLTFLVVSQPSGGGKVYLNPTTGDLAFLPDLSTVETGGTETFKVVVAETTTLTSALTGIPLIGGLASQVLVVLYQIPVVNVLLSPIIGRSEITTVPITVGQFVDPDDPVAFTVMVPSDDGVMISTNYFPGTAVVESGGEIKAPTILNGPGLATAGNINPTAANTVDGLVSGIDELRDAGYNVVTWDPRGEFDSTEGFSSIHRSSRARTSKTSSPGSPTIAITPSPRWRTAKWAATHGSAWSEVRMAAGSSLSPRPSTTASTSSCRASHGTTWTNPFTRVKRSRPHTRRCCC